MIQNKVEKILTSAAFMNIIKLWLTSVILLIPFQQKVIRIEPLWGELRQFISIVDELTIALLFPIALIKLFREKKDIILLSQLLCVLMVMFASGILSGLLNGNFMTITVLGSFDYIKNFLVIFIFAAFFNGYRMFKTVFRVLLVGAVLLCVYALIQEIWALVGRYIFRMDIYDPALYILRKAPGLIEEGWRFGIYRTASLMYNNNMFGLYSLLILTIYLYTEKKINPFLVTLLIVGVVVSVSRMVYAGFAILFVLQIFKGRKWFLLFVIPGLIILNQLGTFEVLKEVRTSGISTIETISLLDTKEESVMLLDNYVFRQYAKEKAVIIWKDYPIWGVGPGIFGGSISVKFGSHLYGEYNFKTMSYVERIKGIDQFWPQLLAETGIIGTAAFLGIIIFLIMTLYYLRQKAASSEERGLLSALLMYTVVIIIYLFGSGLNLSAVLFTYSAFVGIGINPENKQITYSTS